MNAKDLAINLIEYYVKRGDSLESLKHSYMGEGDINYDVAIGGHAFKGDELVHKGTCNEIVVSKMEGKDVCYIFSLDKLFSEIKSGQMKLI